MGCGSSPLFFDLIQVDVVAWDDEDKKLDSGSDRAREEARGRRRLKEGRMEDLGCPIYKGRADRDGARNEETKTLLSSGPDASILGMVSKGKDPLEDMTE